MEKAAAPCDAGPTLRLLGVPTAQKNALETGSVNAEAGLLLFAILKKSFNERSGCQGLGVRVRV